MNKKEAQSYANAINQAFKKPILITGEPRAKSNVKTTADHLKDMAYYFELDETKVKFYINQLESTGHI